MVCISNFITKKTFSSGSFWVTIDYNHHMTLEIYTEYDAVHDIILWQIPAAFLIALLAVIYMLSTHSFPVSVGTSRWEYSLFVFGYILTCFLTTYFVFLCLDAVLLPPLFSLVRLSHSF